MARKKKPPKIKLPRKIKKGDIINVAVQPKYPSITGLATIGDTDDFYRKEPAVYLKEMEVFYGKEKVCTFLMSSAVSQNPRIEFPLKADKEATLKVVFQSNQNETFKASKEIKFS
ncbi:MAG: thiosulfate oxidation carrier complex protein SoxZ [Nitrospinota bacterium]|nr:thiosulfate oxidation carrier complex protein SoxZ [Nitrospinota bacterium]MDP7555061.1 thiosulfate oxidation carrier complex protein SoxZ [Nitrospinota bacterium]HJN02677.1 thiosulfate oxidation carrier complex protein SoxZ [Nitrospinota bacterium]